MICAFVFQNWHNLVFNYDQPQDDDDDDDARGVHDSDDSTMIVEFRIKCTILHSGSSMNAHFY